MKRLVLLPGMDGTDAFFRPFVACRPPDVDVRTFHYDSIDVDSYEALRQHVAAELPQEDFFVLGWSFSGPLALMLAANRMPQLRGVILVASFVRRPVRFLPAWSKLFARPSLFAFYPTASMTQARLQGYSTPQLRALQREAFSRAKPRALATRVQMLLDVDARDELRSCPVPILYVQARDDRVIHRGHGKQIVAETPRATLVEVPGPHLCLATHPLDAWTAIAPFLDAHSR